MSRSPGSRAALAGTVADAGRRGREGRRGGARAAAEGAAAPTLERPKRAEFGDYSTNAALLLAPRLGAPPRELAERLGAALQGAARRPTSTATTSPGPGFLNLFMSDAWCRRALAAVAGGRRRLRRGRRRRAGRQTRAASSSSRRTRPGRCTSATPATPPTATRSRGCWPSTATASTREFYVNDAGSPDRKLGESIRARARGEEVPEDGYRGEYVAELAAEIAGRRRRSTRPSSAGAAVAADARPHARPRSRAFRVLDFDHWHHESAAARGRTRAPSSTRSRCWPSRGTPTAPRARYGCARRDFGDDKDRVLVRSTGEHTYFASDIAYHQDKRARGFERQVDVLGRRPPRLRRAHEGGLRRRSAATPIGSSC